MTLDELWSTLFPSPLGVSYFQIFIWQACKVSKMFPSPLGVSYFQIKYVDVAVRVSHDLFPSPLGVSYFQMKKTYFEKERIKFPSPLGVSYFQIKGGLPYIRMLSVSVPSRGILFPNRTRKTD